MLRPLAVCLCLLLAGACAADDPIPSSDSGADPTAITSTVLLDAVDQSILGSILEYPDSGQAEITASLIEVPPGADTGWHYHETPLVAYVLSGEITVTYDMPDGPVERTYEAGQSLVEEVDIHHYGRNDGDEMARLLVVFVGAEGSSNTVGL